VPYLAALVYVAVGLYRWHRERHDIEREDLLSQVLWTLILGSLVNVVLWVGFYR
jgi:hypothetical protein